METANDPQWIPYIPQPRTREERIAYLFKRYGFAGVCTVLGLVIALVLLFFQEPLSKEPPQEEPSAALMLPFPPSAHDSSSIGPNEETAMLSVTSHPDDGATVLLNRDTLGTTPLRNYKLRTGAYLLTVEKEGYAQADSVILLRRDATPEVVVRFDGGAPTMAVQRENDSSEQREVRQPAVAQASETRSSSTERVLHRSVGWQESEEQRRTRINGYVQEALKRSGLMQDAPADAAEEQSAATADVAETEADTAQTENEQPAEKVKKRVGW